MRQSPMILGINPTKTGITIATTKGRGPTFTITRIQSIPYHVQTTADLAALLRRLKTLFNLPASRKATIALLKCSSGRFGSCLEAIKGEAMTELAAFQTKLPIEKIAPQSLKKSLGCAADQKWRDRAAELFNPTGKLPDWTRAAAGAISAAHKLANI